MRLSEDRVRWDLPPRVLQHLTRVPNTGRTKWYLCSAKPSDPRNLHSPKEHAEGISDADEVQSSHSTIHISPYTWSLVPTEYCLLEG